MQVLSVVEVEEVAGGAISLGQALLTGGYLNVGLRALSGFISSGGSPDYSRVTSHGDMY